MPAIAQAPDQAPCRSGDAATISVSGLRIPPKAREHYVKAREAAKARHAEQYQREINKAFQLAPEYPDAYLLVANWENTAGHFELALNNARRAQSIDPNVAGACIQIASAYNGERRYDQAFAILDNLRGGEALTWQAQYETARAEVGRGHAESALRWSKLAFGSAPKTWIDARLLVADALQLAHRWKEASEEMDLYLASKSPLIRRAPVELALAHTRLLAQQEELAELAPR